MNLKTKYKPDRSYLWFMISDEKVIDSYGRLLITTAPKVVRQGYVKLKALNTDTVTYLIQIGTARFFTRNPVRDHYHIEEEKRKAIIFNHNHAIDTGRKLHNRKDKK